MPTVEPQFVTMIGPDGKPGQVPNGRVSAAEQAGYKQASQMYDHNGNAGWVSNDRIDAAKDAGYQVGSRPGVFTGIYDTVIGGMKNLISRDLSAGDDSDAQVAQQMAAQDAHKSQQYHKAAADFHKGMANGDLGSILSAGKDLVDLFKVAPGSNDKNAAHVVVSGAIQGAEDQYNQAKTHVSNVVSLLMDAADRHVHGDFQGAQQRLQQIPLEASEGAGHGLAAALPLVGPAAADAGETFGQGNNAYATGKSLGLLLPAGVEGLRGTGVIGKAGDVAIDAAKGAAGAIASKVGDTASKAAGAAANAAGRATVAAGKVAGKAAVNFAGGVVDSLSDSLSDAIQSKLNDIQQGASASDVFATMRDLKNQTISTLTQAGMGAQKAARTASDLIATVQDNYEGWKMPSQTPGQNTASGIKDAVQSILNDAFPANRGGKTDVARAAQYYPEIADVATKAQMHGGGLQTLSDLMRKYDPTGLLGKRIQTKYDLPAQELSNSIVGKMIDDIHSSDMTTDEASAHVQQQVAGMMKAANDQAGAAADELAAQAPYDSIRVTTALNKAISDATGSPLQAYETGQLIPLSDWPSIRRGIVKSIDASDPAALAKMQTVDNLMANALDTDKRAGFQSLLQKQMEIQGIAQTALYNKLLKSDPDIVGQRLLEAPADEFNTILGKLGPEEANLARRVMVSKMTEAAIDRKTGIIDFEDLGSQVQGNKAKLGEQYPRIKATIDGLAQMQEDAAKIKDKAPGWILAGAAAEGLVNVLTGADPIHTATMMGVTVLAPYVIGRALMDYALAPGGMEELSGVLKFIQTRVPSTANIATIQKKAQGIMGKIGKQAAKYTDQLRPSEAGRNVGGPMGGKLGNILGFSDADTATLSQLPTNRPLDARDAPIIAQYLKQPEDQVRASIAKGAYSSPASLLAVKGAGLVGGGAPAKLVNQHIAVLLQALGLKPEENTIMHEGAHAALGAKAGLTSHVDTAPHVLETPGGAVAIEGGYHMRLPWTKIPGIVMNKTLGQTVAPTLAAGRVMDLMRGLTPEAAREHALTDMELLKKALQYDANDPTSITDSHVEQVFQGIRPAIEQKLATPDMQAKLRQFSDVYRQRFPGKISEQELRKIFTVMTMGALLKQALGGQRQAAN